MKTLIALIALCFLTAASCQQKPVPQPQPSPGGTTCETDFENLKRLGGCGLNMEKFLANCHDREKFEAELGTKNDHACTSHGETCAVVRACK